MVFSKDFLPYHQSGKIGIEPIPFLYFFVPKELFMKAALCIYLLLILLLLPCTQGAAQQSHDFYLFVSGSTTVNQLANGFTQWIDSVRELKTMEKLLPIDFPTLKNTLKFLASQKNNIDSMTIFICDNSKKSGSFYIAILVSVNSPLTKATLDGVKISQIDKTTHLFSSSAIKELDYKSFAATDKNLQSLAKKKKMQSIMNIKHTTLLLNLLTNAIDNYRYTIPGLKEVLQKITNTRLYQGNKGKLQITLTFNSEDNAKEGRRLFNGFSELFKAITKGGLLQAQANSPNDPNIEMLKATNQYISSAKILQKAKKVVYQINDATSYAKILSLQKLAVEKTSFQKNPSQNKKDPIQNCLRNMKTMEGALELFAMENIEDAPPPSLEELVKQGYLRTPPICLSEGIYKIKKDEANVGNFLIECTTHGKLEDLR
jgi:hypothetical protein